MKTAMQELIEKLEHTKLNSCKHLYEVVFFDGILAIIEGGNFLETEKQQIIEAVTHGNRMEFYDASETAGEQYYNETFKN